MHPITLLLEILGRRMHGPSPLQKNSFGGRSPSPPKSQPMYSCKHIMKITSYENFYLCVGPMLLCIRDVNKDLTPKDQDKDKDLTPKDQDKDKDLTPKAKNKDKDRNNTDKE